jgi:ABC-type nitrate/sulfonate/bicarbonate transport system substrate-binding protein
MKKKICIFVVIVFILATLSSIFMYSNHYNQKPVTINVSDILQIRSAPFFIARDKGFYKENHLNVNIIRKNKGSVALQSSRQSVDR